jgi:AcrR family transcriptional regulator
VKLAIDAKKKRATTIESGRSVNPPKRRNAAATRQRILEAAQEAFIRAGYNGAGVREICASAGVSPMLVNRYFGSKDKLFREVVELIFRRRDIVITESMGPGQNLFSFTQQIARELVNKTASSNAPLDGFMLMLRSLGSDEAILVLRETIGREFVDPLAASFLGSDTKAKAAMLLSLIAGFQLMRRAVRLDALTRIEAEVLIRHLTVMMDRLLSEDVNPK